MWDAVRGHGWMFFESTASAESWAWTARTLIPTWLCIPQGCFRAVDLSRPFQLAEFFDLAVCLEVAEHLPKQSARGLISSLVRLAPVVLFSAAVPLQGGTHHVNEQWPAYWQDLFEQHGYRMLDLIRKEIWSKPEVQFWYRQNIFLFMREDLVAARPGFPGSSGVCWRFDFDSPGNFGTAV
jgi:hypothetical protein